MHKTFESLINTNKCEFDIPYCYVIYEYQNRKCYCCNNDLMESNTILDIKNDKLGFIKGNVILCCKTCFIIKQESQDPNITNNLLKEECNYLLKQKEELTSQVEVLKSNIVQLNNQNNGLVIYNRQLNNELTTLLNKLETMKIGLEPIEDQYNIILKHYEDHPTNDEQTDVNNESFIDKAISILSKLI
jgi:Zn-finger protein